MLGDLPINCASESQKVPGVIRASASRPETTVIIQKGPARATDPYDIVNIGDCG